MARHGVWVEAVFLYMVVGTRVCVLLGSMYQTADCQACIVVLQGCFGLRGCTIYCVVLWGHRPTHKSAQPTQARCVGALVGMCACVNVGCVMVCCTLGWHACLCLMQVYSYPVVCQLCVCQLCV